MMSRAAAFRLLTSNPLPAAPATVGAVIDVDRRRRAAFRLLAGSVSSVVVPDGTFDAFIAWPNREEILLAEIDALLLLTGWTATGGHANTYQVSVSNVTAPPTGHEALYRRVTGVRDEASNLVGVDSVASVNASPGRWYWDEATGLLYVRTTGAAVDPDTRAAIAARVTFYTATTTTVLDRVTDQPSTGICYVGGLAPGGGPTSSEESPLFGGTSVSWGGECVLTNGHAAWCHLVAPESAYYFKHQQVRFSLGGSYAGRTLTRAQYAPISTMLVDDIVADDTTCRIALKPPIAHLSDVSVPMTPYFESEYPRLGDGVRGTYKAVLYGRAWTSPALTDTAGFGVWTVADAAAQSLTAVHGVEAVARSGGARVVLSEGQDYTVNLSACTVTVVNARYVHTAWSLRVEATGKTSMHAEGGGAVGMRGYLSTAAEIARDLCHTFAGLLAADVDGASFTEAHADAREELAVYLTAPRSLASILSSSDAGQPSISRSVQGAIGQDRTGRISMRVWAPDADTSTLRRLRKEDVSAFVPSPRLERYTTGARVWFGYDGRDGTNDSAEAIDGVARLLTGVPDVEEVQTYLRGRGDADVLAMRYRRAASASTIDVDFAESGTLLALSNVGERVLVTYDPAPDASGGYAERIFVLTRLERGYAPMTSIRGQMRDVHLLVNRVGRWKGPAAPTYAGASAAQRVQSGYWGGVSPSSALGWQ